jgi:hypothetical protein
MAAKENLNPLKTLVFSMGLLLIGGTVLLGTLVWKKIAAETSGLHATADCPGGNVDLKGRGTMVDSVVDGHTMRVTLEKNNGKNEMVMIDICSGKIIGSLTLDTDAKTLPK